MPCHWGLEGNRYKAGTETLPYTCVTQDWSSRACGAFGECEVNANMATEEYSTERRAEFLLFNAVDDEDYARAKEEVPGWALPLSRLSATESSAALVLRRARPASGNDSPTCRLRKLRSWLTKPCAKSGGKSARRKIVESRERLT